MKDLHVLPKVRDSWSYLYVERCRVDQEDQAIAVHDADGMTPVPCASLTALVVGPGTTVTHAAVRTLAENGCLLVWSGEEGVRFYAQGMGETRSATNLLKQARLCSDPATRLLVVRRMYELRFPNPLDPGLTLEQIRGMEGIRVRKAYAQAGDETGVRWSGRSYKRDRWGDGDPVNRALSAANACLYGVCHAAIVSAGYSPTLGFVHTGKMLSFVYDVADLYKTEVSVPVAFAAAAASVPEIETFVRRACRDQFKEKRILGRIVRDIEKVLDVGTADGAGDAFDEDAALPGGLWDEDRGSVEGGVNWAGTDEGA